jgi:hypothetical protein
MNKLLLTLPFFFLIACSAIKTKSVEEILSSNDEIFNYVDKNGTFTVKASSGIDKKAKTYITKRSLSIPDADSKSVLEKSIAISSVGVLKNKTSILRPKHSQYTVWFDGKKYFSEMKINPKKKSVELKMISPESQWSGTKSFPFPSATTLPCFFSQIIECAKISGFIKTASDKKNGTMNLMIIWEGYPYLNETFSEFPSEIFSRAQLEYDGKTKESERRFNLRVAGQSIYYVLNEQDNMIKMFWVTQGISMVSKSSQSGETSTLDEDQGGIFE